MGILTDLKKNDIASRLESATIPQCVVPDPTLNFHPCVCGCFSQWRDSYGFWHCVACEPPRFPAMIRADRCLSRTGPQIDAQAFVVAVSDPDGSFAFADFLTQTQRHEQIENFAWCDRVANRKLKKRT